LHVCAATGHTASWTLFALSQHPEAEARLAAELAQHGLLATPERPVPRATEWDDIPKLTYLQAVIKVPAASSITRSHD
jgi:cytochrome P450